MTRNCRKCGRELESGRIIGTCDACLAPTDGQHGHKLYRINNRVQPQMRIRARKVTEIKGYKHG